MSTGCKTNVLPQEGTKTGGHRQPGMSLASARKSLSTTIYKPFTPNEFDQLHQRQGTPGTRPGITETAPNLNGRWNRRLNKREHPMKKTHLNTGYGAQVGMVRLLTNDVVHRYIHLQGQLSGNTEACNQNAQKLGWPAGLCQTHKKIGLKKKKTYIDSENSLNQSREGGHIGAKTV
eukprot:1156597-Pelagomonas_calceolata.AAC.1